MERLTDLESAQRIDDRMRVALDPSRESWHLPHMTEDRMTKPASDAMWPLLQGETLRIKACTANRCSSGDRACPCPDACRLPEGLRLDWLMSALDRIEPGHFWIGYAALIGAAIGGLCLAFR